jgi:hypothetical protein
MNLTLVFFVPLAVILIFLLLVLLSDARSRSHRRCEARRRVTLGG